jgi:hypothetical protein
VQAFVRAKNGGRDKKGSSIVMSILLYSIVLLPLLAFFLFIFVYDPTQLWKDLDEAERQLVLNGTVKFAGVNVRFSELFSVNDSNAMAVLNYEQILVLRRGRVLDLSKDKNVFLEGEIYLSYWNLSDGLREKFEGTAIDFQGNAVELQELVGNASEIYDTLSSSEIFDLLKNRTELKVGGILRSSGDGHDQDLVNLDNLPIYDVEKNQNLSISSQKLLSNSNLILLTNITSISNLSKHFKDHNPKKWIEYIDLKTHTTTLNDITRGKFDINEILSKFFKVKSRFEMEVLRKFIDDRNVVVFWDRFDEVKSSSIEDVFNLMVEIKRENAGVQFLAIHPQYEEYIAEQFDGKIYKVVL